MSDDSITSMQKEQRVFPPPSDFSSNAHIKSMQQYEEEYKRSIENPEAYWAEKAEQLDWYKKWDSVFRYTEPPFFKWFEGGQINVAYNCLDRHLTTWRKNKAAIIWEAEDGESKTFTYQQLHREVCKFANVLKKKGINKGDRVCLYMPMIPELAIAMLACARIGAVHSIVFGGFSAESLKKRIQDCEAKMLITADGAFRAKKIIKLKETSDLALQECPSVEVVVVAKRTNNEIEFVNGRDVWWDDEMKEPDVNNLVPPEVMDSEDPLFILYTSGTTGKPKGMLHTTAGYLLYAQQTFKYIFDHHDEDTYWCTADIGWITGHSYIVYGPLANGATSIMFESVPTYPTPDRFWKICEKYDVSLFYTAPTAIRAVAKEGDQWVQNCDISKLRLLGSVGEPINPEAWMWYFDKVGAGHCPIVDTWWQTETGGILISPLPGATPLKPGSATKPFFGIQPEIWKEDGSVAKANEGGYLVIKKPWPSLARTVWGDPDRYRDTYFGKFGSEIYLAGDSARIDEDGYFWIMGRLDDVVNVSGHRLGTAEVESALVSHEKVAESAIVPFPHEIKGEALYAFVTLNTGVEKTDELKKELCLHVRKEIGPIAMPDKIQFADSLPKTRSGKIMRRILKAIAKGENEVGDTTTLADPTIVQTLVENRV